MTWLTPWRLVCWRSRIMIMVLVMWSVCDLVW